RALCPTVAGARRPTNDHAVREFHRVACPPFAEIRLRDRHGVFAAAVQLQRIWIVKTNNSYDSRLGLAAVENAPADVDGSPSSDPNQPTPVSRFCVENGRC